MTELLERIKKSFFNSVLKQRAAQIYSHHVVNFQLANTIGIIYDSTDTDNDITLTKFAELLRSKGKQVELLGYLHDKNIDHKADVQIFNRNSVNWYGIPNDLRVNDFCNKKFDLLLCGFINENLPLEYVATFSQASYRVGAFDPTKTHCYDLMIERGEKRNLNYLLLRMVQVLEQIKA